MTFEEIKKILNEYKGLKRRLKSEGLRLAELRSMLTGMRATDYSRERISGGSKDNTYTENILDRISCLEERLNGLMSRIFEIEDIISDNMDNLTQTEQAMIIDRYMNGWNWAKICKNYNYADRQPYRIVENALKKMSKCKDDSK